MANPRQRRKTRSSTHRAVSHSSKAKKNLKKVPAIRGPKVLQEAWDKKKTVRQNYAALGLASSLNPTLSGGVERDVITVPDHQTVGSSGHATPATSGASSLRPGRGRIIRDAEGNVVGVELPEEEEAQGGIQEETETLPEAEIDSQVMAKWAHGLGAIPKSAKPPTKNVIPALESISSSARSKRRFTSTAEGAYLARLVRKHDDDVSAMSRDRRLNPEQRTEGQLRRAIEKAGGIQRVLERGN